MGQVVGNVDASAFHRAGWLHLGRVLTDAELQMLQSLCFDADDLVRSPIMGSTENQLANGAAQGHAVTQASPKFRQMFDRQHDLRISHPMLASTVKKFGDIATTLLDEDVRILSDVTFAKGPASVGGRATVWHQDWPSFPLDRRGLLIFWVALHDLPLPCGPLQFLPRSHRVGPLGRPDYEDDLDYRELLRPADLELIDQPVAAPLGAGEAVVFDALTLHASLPNRSDTWRHAWTLRMIPASTRWTGAPMPLADVEDVLPDPLGTFEDARFLVPDVQSPR
jgi:ectoine hydroxylase-related dioxygenase (phytanoyl-CoA dioxygenase family)